MTDIEEECYHLLTQAGCFWMVRQKPSRDWCLGVTISQGASMLLGFYRTAQAAAAAVSSGLTGWPEWDRVPRPAGVPENLAGWSEGLRRDPLTG